MCSIILFCFILLSMLKVKFLDKVVEIDDRYLKNITIDELKEIIIKKLDLPLSKNEIFLKSLDGISLINNNSIDKISEIEVNTKLKGGFGVAIFVAIIIPVLLMGKSFLRIGEILVKFIELFVSVMQIIPLIFDPPRFIDDILFGITWGINNLFSKVIASMNTEKEEDPNSESGTFGVSEENQKLYTCADPTLGMILLLVVCPPLAIFYKLGIEGLVSAIICGVLCVKLYYFPGLLFAILHVLC